MRTDARAGELAAALAACVLDDAPEVTALGAVKITAARERGRHGEHQKLH
jgi:hypothetical protein